MKKPKDRETTERENMMCTNCYTEGLEEHPAYEDEYSGLASLLKATRCPNEECRYHKKRVPREDIEMQMPDRNLSIGLPQSISVKDVAIVAFVFVSIIALSLSLGIPPSNSDGQSSPDTLSTVIEGSVLPMGDEYPEIVLYNGTTVDSVQSDNGTYSLDITDINAGRYLIYTKYSGLGNPKAKQIQINGSDENINVNFSELPTSNTINLSRSAGRSEIVLNYTNPANIQDLELDLDSGKGPEDTREQSLSQSRDQKLLMPVFPQAQQYRVESSLTYKEFNTTGTYSGQPKQYRIYGNKKAESLEITLPENVRTDTVSRTFKLTGQRSDGQISISSNETLGPATVTFKNGSSINTERVSGTWDNSGNINITSGSNFVPGDIQVTPSTQKSQKSISGTIESQQITHRFDGNIPTSNTIIQFTGGDIQASTEGSESLTLDAENGSTGEITRDLSQLERGGSYRLELDAEYGANRDLANLYYSINGEKTSIQGSKNETLDLDPGDDIDIGGSADLDTLVDDSTPPSGSRSLSKDLEVQEIEFSEENPDKGSVITVTVTIKNTGSSEVTDTVEIYQNKDLIADKRVTVAPGDQTELGLFDLGEQVTSNTAGLSVWRVNQRDPKFLPVGIESRQFGSASLEAELLDIGTRGTVNVDTDGDGEYDCEAKSSTGTCEIGSLEPGRQIIEVQQEGVDETTYSIEYTSRENPAGVSLDVGDDGITELSADGVLREPVSSSVEIPPGKSAINVSVDNSVPFDYLVVWDSTAVINDPVLYVDGEKTVSQVGSFVEERTFEIGTLQQGEHDLNFRSSSGGYEAKIEWREQPGQSYPATDIDGERVCQPEDFANNLTCSVSSNGISPGRHTLEFPQSAKDSFSYAINQESVAVANNVQILVNGQPSQTFSRDNLDEVEEWTTRSSTNDFLRGENNVSVDVEEVNGMIPNVNTTLFYKLDAQSTEKLDIEVIDPDGNSNTTTVGDNQSLLSEEEVEIPSSWFGVGKNRIRIDPTPVDGVFDIESRLILNKDEGLEFGTLG